MSKQSSTLTYSSGSTQTHIHFEGHVLHSILCSICAAVKISEDSSLFTYGEVFGRRKRQTPGSCTSFETCSGTPYVGPSFEDLTFNETQREICNNERTCLFDLAVTNNVELAILSRELTTRTSLIQQTIGKQNYCCSLFCSLFILISLVANSPPSISGDEVFDVIVGEVNVYNFVVTDSDNFTVMIDGDPPDNSLFVDDGEGKYTFTWTPVVTPTTELSFVAEDELGAVTLLSPVLQVCTCFNEGECILEGVPSTNRLIRHLTCICTDGKSNFI